MGGRGSSSGISDKGKKYDGTEYHTVYQSGNIKFIKINEGAVTAPIETMTKGRVYVTLDNKDNPKFISYYDKSNKRTYDKSNKRTKQIDLDRPHKGVVPHTHHGYLHNENDTAKGFSNLTTEEKQLVDLINKIWNNRGSGS